MSGGGTNAAACGSQSVRNGPGVIVRTIVLGLAAAIAGTSSACERFKYLLDECVSLHYDCKL